MNIGLMTTMKLTVAMTMGVRIKGIVKLIITVVMGITVTVIVVVRVYCGAVYLTA